MGQYEWKVFGALKWKDIFSKTKWWSYGVISFEKHIEQYKLKVFGVLNNERTKWAKRMNGLLKIEMTDWAIQIKSHIERLILKE